MKLSKYVLGAFFSFVMLIACGGKEEKKKEGFSYDTKEETTNKKNKKETSGITEVVITGNDLMQFDKTQIKVKAGEKVKLTLRHKGKLDINVMGHNVVILKQGVDVTTFAGKAAVARDNEYIPKDSEDAVVAYTKTIGGGQTTSIEFDAPEAGTYDFICSFPGHYGMMKGKFIVE